MVMENLNRELRRSIQKLKAYEINKLRKIQQDQNAFFREIREKLQGELVTRKSHDDILSPKQITAELNISRKTFDRWTKDGLAILQRDTGKSIRVKRVDLENYLKDKYNVR